MKVSLNWIKEIGFSSDVSVDEVVKRIGSQLGEIESVEHTGEQYKDVVIVKIVSCEKLADTNHLNVCMVDDGGKVKSADRDNNGLVRVVCGAPNVAAGQMAVWLPIGSIVPETFGKDNFKIEAKEIKGVVSNGMLTSAKELGISEDHYGIAVLNPDEVKPGDSFSDVFKLDDYIIDIENKMFTHRPDCFGQLGIAREVAGIFGQKFTSPEWYLNYDDTQLKSDTNNLPFEVVNEIPELVPRFMAIALEVEDNPPSPMWLQAYLSKVGIRPISLVVDITNFIMISTAQPLHAYDYDKVKAMCADPSKVSIHIRLPKEGEKIKLLNGKEISPKPKDIMIATDSKLIGVGGVMGGSDTEVDSNTKRIILECANFNMYAIRRTSMANGLFTEAVTRFNKGQSPLQNDRILSETVVLLKQLVNANVESQLVDIFSGPKTAPKLPVIETKFINERLGSNLTDDSVSKLLQNVEFGVTPSSGGIELQVPFWRTDIGIKEDIVEEVGRLDGYDKLKLILPRRTRAPVVKEPMLELKNRVSNILVGSGANEVLTYNFVHGQLLDKVGQNRELSFQLANAISPNLQYYRVSLLPSLLDRVNTNIKLGFGEFALFEINKVHIKTLKDSDEPDLPAEEMRLAIVFAADSKTAKEKYTGAPYYQAMAYLEYLLGELGIEFNVKSLDHSTREDSGLQALAPFEPIRTGLVMAGEVGLGIVGEPRNSVKRELKLPEFTSMIELDMKQLIKLAKSKDYVKLSSYPMTDQDVCFKLPDTVSYQKLKDLVNAELSKLTNVNFGLSIVDIYKKSPDAPDKQITFRITLTSYEKTLTTAELSAVISGIGSVAGQQLQAEII